MVDVSEWETVSHATALRLIQVDRQRANGLDDDEAKRKEASIIVEDDADKALLWTKLVRAVRDGDVDLIHQLIGGRCNDSPVNRVDGNGSNILLGLAEDQDHVEQALVRAGAKKM